MLRIKNAKSAFKAKRPSSDVDFQSLMVVNEETMRNELGSRHEDKRNNLIAEFKIRGNQT